MVPKMLKVSGRAAAPYSNDSVHRIVSAQESLRCTGLGQTLSGSGGAGGSVGANGLYRHSLE